MGSRGPLRKPEPMSENATRTAVMRLLTEAFPGASLCVFIHEQQGEPKPTGEVTIQHTVWTNCKENELLFAFNAGAMQRFLEGESESFSFKSEAMN